MDLPEDFKSIRPEAKATYLSLPPLRKRIALQMMVAAAHMTNQIHIERAEEILKQQDEWLAWLITNQIVDGHT